MVALLAFATTVAIVVRSIHNRRSHLTGFALAIVGLLAGVVTLIRNGRSGGRLSLALPTTAVVLSVAALAGGLVFFIVH